MALRLATLPVAKHAASSRRAAFTLSRHYRSDVVNHTLASLRLYLDFLYKQDQDVALPEYIAGPKVSTDIGDRKRLSLRRASSTVTPHSSKPSMPAERSGIP
ncbi:hypothetical protein, variant 6 [Cryptococcus amylolentus CBS 6039]|uniref:Uncharacterized protein n=1 Tax=Cryptococcus amylolentus CBS 6039 TaxID=1295533 RepID=A0A1E3HVM4_9TREE|nr:hypothetical protein L202_02625 [Cryptococcus amylolentus CBS 6039]XP_018994930.1 hypothetical protein, variant 1 [Cryptococcus amylolentus CBS 6039]XP_018994931.1 hypothetical protein, variant 2 [Cryptococcus amylolentus CBS 6039]XP_018994932.1 hypothetical protein, variant 3 [Cryptococcus amylolentus CBS 6039]XP_018994933.1 hypothetical protein, variant 4 [Cryptococcus amylolentus CBS 6039]XP_018994934.1 hypothetical protein, variant 5 [Cryptococcus amylolentus CBS 6039]XP_018994935.1 hy